MMPASKTRLIVGDTVVVKHGRALGLGTVIVINPSGEVLVSWDSVGLNLHTLTSLEIVQPSKLYKS